MIVRGELYAVEGSSVDGETCNDGRMECSRDAYGATVRRVADGKGQVVNKEERRRRRRKTLVAEEAEEGDGGRCTSSTSAVSVLLHRYYSNQTGLFPSCATEMCRGKSR